MKKFILFSVMGSFAFGFTSKEALVQSEPKVTIELVAIYKDKTQEVFKESSELKNTPESIELRVVPNVNHPDYQKDNQDYSFQYAKYNETLITNGKTYSSPENTVFSSIKFDVEEYKKIVKAETQIQIEVRSLPKFRKNRLEGSKELAVFTIPISQ